MIAESSSGTLEVTSDPRQWESWCDRAGLHDVYYRFSYLHVWEEHERARAFGIRLMASSGVVLYPVLLVPLDALPRGSGLCDLRTPYDFGGPLALGDDPADLLALFEKHMAEARRDWRVVSEFCRLHPFAHRALPPDATLHAHNQWVDLSGGYQAAYERYDPKWRNQLRAALRTGIEVEFTAVPSREEVETFFHLYTDTMARVGASEEYAFSRPTIERLLALPESWLATARYQGRPVASAIFLRSVDDLFYFLSASDGASRKYRPNNALLDRAAARASDLGCRRLHLGGGAPGLRHFKAQMGPDTVPYHVLRRIHRPADYSALAGDPSSPDFPPWRSLLRRG
jgi:hypothetical protein